MCGGCCDMFCSFLGLSRIPHRSIISLPWLYIMFYNFLDNAQRTDPEGELYRKFGTGSVPFHVIIDKKFSICHSEEKFDGPQLIQLLNKCFKEKI